MCKLIIGVKNKVGENTELNSLFDLQWADMKTQRDGCGAMVINEDGSCETKRSLKDYDSVNEWLRSKRDGAKIFGLHTRVCTSGGISESNVHFFEDHGVYIAHNGWLEGRYGFASDYHDSGYSSRSKTGFKSSGDVAQTYLQQQAEKIRGQMDYPLNILNSCKRCQWFDGVENITCHKHVGERNRFDKLFRKYNETLNSLEETNLALPWGDGDKKTHNEVDTLEFLKSIPRPLTKENIEEAVKKTKFTGASFMYDSNTKKAWYVVRDKTVPTILRGEYGIVFSFSPETTIKSVVPREAFGLRIWEDVEYDVAEEDKGELENGVYEIDFGYKKKSK